MIKNGLIAGVIGAIILAVLAYIMMFVTGDPPPAVAFYRGILQVNNPPIDHLIAGTLFLIAGGIWGAIYAAIIKHPSVMNGLLFSILPTLFVWLVMQPASGLGFFGGFAAKAIILPLILNAIWGAFVGWYLSRNVVHTKPVAV